MRNTYNDLIINTLTSMNRFFILSALLTIFVVSSVINSDAQDIKYVRKQLQNLCSPELHGRGYYLKGDSLAADYLENEFKKLGLKPYGPDYFQKYAFNVNNLTEVSLKINGKEMAFGKDYMIVPSSKSFTGSFKPLIINSDLMKNPSELTDIIVGNKSHPVVILDSLGLNNPELYHFVRSLAVSGVAGISSVLEVHPNVPGGRVGRSVLPVAHFQVKRESLPAEISSIGVKVSNEYEENYTTRNLIGYIPGHSEKVILFTAHYDMLGSFGEDNFFPGANDNASGTTMVLDLARHFSSGKKPWYTMAFLLVSGEEAGLLGSRYYANNPLFPLEKINLVINLDMVGTGQDGVNLFNAPNRPRETAIIHKINREKQYMVDVEERESKANSDHYPFQEKGVPAIFFLTKGKAGSAHQTADSPENLPLYGYENLFRLILDTLNELQRQEVE
jgi:aminopeptidase YwaD